MDEPMIVEVSRERLGSIAEAQTKASFSILAPANLPSGTQVDEVHYGVWPGHEGQRGFDWVWIYYLRADGKRFAIRQGNVAGVVIDEATPPSAHGVVAVPGHPSATWLNGKPTMAADGHHVSGWEPGLLSLGWKPTQDLDSDLPRTLVIMASDDDFELGDLVAIASLIR